MRCTVLLLTALLLHLQGAAAHAAGNDVQASDTTQNTVQPGETQHVATSPYALAVRFSPQRSIGLDQYTRTWLKGKQTYSVSLEASLDTRRKYANEKGASYARDYGYPTFTAGLRYNFNHGVTMHRDAADWGADMEVPYTTHMGDILTLYGRFDRPLFRTRRWSGGYYLGTGLGYAMSHYDKTRHIDNELIGTHLNIFFTTGLFVNYRLSSGLAVEAGLDFSHHSNGALYRPNKGANYLGPFIGLKHTLNTPQNGMRQQKNNRTNQQSDEEKEKVNKGAFADDYEQWRRRPLFVELTVGVGAKTLNEDWQQTQFNSSPDAPDYRTDKFAVYGAFSLQADVMYRYARRWASGLGFDIFYGDYANKLSTFAGNAADRISPWSMAIAVKHEAFYGPITARVGFGIYVYRHMGSLARAVEQPYYERVGLTYRLPHMGGLSVGFNINAHKTKADFTELSLAFPIRL